jgi:hypothetical protein
MVLGVLGCWNLLRVVCNMKKRLGTRINHISNSGRSLFIIFLVIGMIMISLNTEQYIQNKAIADLYSPSQNGVHPVQIWFTENSMEDDSILVMGSSRYWAWFLDRMAISFHSWENGRLVPDSEMNETHLLDLLEVYNVTYVLVDTSSLWSRRWPDLAILYENPIIGQSFIVQNENISFTLQCQLKSDAPSNNGTLIVFSINKNPNVIAYFKEDFDTEDKWVNSTNSYPLEDGDSFNVSKGYLRMNLRESHSWDFDRVYSNNISIPHIDTFVQARFRVNSTSVRALYFTFAQEASISGNWVQWLYLNPEPDSWITTRVLLSDLLQIPDQHSLEIIQNIESIAITALLVNGDVSSIEIDYIYVGFIQIQNEEESAAKKIDVSNSDFVVSENGLAYKSADTLFIIPRYNKAVHKD